MQPSSLSVPPRETTVEKPCHSDTLGSPDLRVPTCDVVSSLWRLFSPLFYRSRCDVLILPYSRFAAPESALHSRRINTGRHPNSLEVNASFPWAPTTSTSYLPYPTTFFQKPDEGSWQWGSDFHLCRLNCTNQTTRQPSNENYRMHRGNDGDFKNYVKREIVLLWQGKYLINLSSIKWCSNKNIWVKEMTKFQNLLLNIQ